MRRLLPVTLALIAVLGSPSIASAQTTASAQPATTPGLPDASGITAFCGGRPAPQPYTGPTVNPTNPRYHTVTADAGTAFAAVLNGAGDPMRAASLYWQAFTILLDDVRPATQAIASEPGQRVVQMLAMVQTDAARAQRCAVVRCLLPRTTGEQHTQLAAIEAQCGPVVTPVSNPPPTAAMQTFVLTVEERAALTFDAALYQRALDEHVLVFEPNNVWRLPVVYYREALTAAVARYRVVNPGPRPPTTPSRSTLNWALHGAGAGVAVLSFATAGVLAAMCSSANQPAEDANAGRTTTGVDRDALARASNLCTAANVMMGVGGVAIAATTVSFFVTAPRTPSGHALGASLTIRF